MAERLMYPIDEALNILGGMGRSTLYELMECGEITAVKVGRRTYFTHEELERYVRSLPISEDGE